MSKLAKTRESDLRTQDHSTKSISGDLNVVYTSNELGTKKSIIMKSSQKLFRDYKLTWRPEGLSTLRVPLLYLQDRLLCSLDHTEHLFFSNGTFYRYRESRSTPFYKAKKLPSVKTDKGYNLIEANDMQPKFPEEELLSNAFNFMGEAYEAFLHENFYNISQAILRGYNEAFNKLEITRKKNPPINGAVGFGKRDRKKKKFEGFVNDGLSAKQIAEKMEIKESTAFNYISKFGLMKEYRVHHPLKNRS